MRRRNCYTFQIEEGCQEIKVQRLGVISNATNWIFIRIDESGQLWRSKKVILNIPSYYSDEVDTVYRMLYHVVKCCYDACTPDTTPNILSAHLTE